MVTGDIFYDADEPMVEMAEVQEPDTKGALQS